MGTVRADESPDENEPNPSAFPEFPRVVLAKPKNIEGDLEVYWAGRVAALLDFSHKADTQQKKAEFLLAAANVALGRQLEAFSSRAAIGISDPVADSPKPVVDEAGKILGEARKVLLGLEPAESRLIHTLEALESFANAQKALLLDEYAGDRRKIASSLAPVLEDADKSVAEAARLWQVLLRATEGDPSPALQILDNPMTSPSPDSWPYGLYSKVLRCRYQAMKGSWSAALIMLSHIEEQLEQWVPQLEHRGDARRLFAYVRFETLKRWHDALPPDRTSERAWCSAQAQAVVREYFSVDSSILRLAPAIPMMFEDDILGAGEAGKPENEKH